MLISIVLAVNFAIICKAHSSNEPDVDKCMELFYPETTTLDCCNGINIWSKHAAECEALFKPTDSSTDWQSDTEVCIMRKYKLLHENGTLDEDAVYRLLDKYAADPTQAATVARIKNNCLRDKFRYYGPAHVCDSTKFYVCGYLNNIMECAEWQYTEECEKLKEMVDMCQNTLEEKLKEITGL